MITGCERPDRAPARAIKIFSLVSQQTSCWAIRVPPFPQRPGILLLQCFLSLLRGGEKRIGNV